MDVHIGEIVSNVRAVDGDSLVTPQTLQKIVGAVMQAVEAREEHADRVQAERRVTGGVSHEQEEG